MKRHSVKTLLLLVCAILITAGIITVPDVFSARAEGTDAPGVIIIKYLQNRYGPVTFDHSMHVSLAGSCGKCHHQHNDKTRAMCGECHSLSAGQFKASVKNGFLPCSGCHTDYSPDTPEMPGLKVAFHKKCFECHIGVGELGSSPEGCVKTCHTQTR